jgi:hypothetical protein
MSDYLTNLIGQQRPKNTVPVPMQTQGPYVPPFPAKPKFKLLPDSPQDALRELGENFGVVGRGLTQGVAAPVTMIADPLTDFINQVLPKGYKQTRPGEAIGQGLDVAGVPRATTDAQKVLEAGTSGLAGGGAIAKTAQLAGKGAQALKGYLDTVGKDLAGQMTSGLGSGAGSVGASQAATASGASPVVAQLAGLGGGIVGGGARPVGGAKSIDPDEFSSWFSGSKIVNQKTGSSERDNLIKAIDFDKTRLPLVAENTQLGRIIRKNLADKQEKLANLPEEKDTPLVVYHGGPAGIDEFKPRKENGRSYWFSDKETANSYKRKEDGAVYATALKAKNPMEYDASGNTWQNLTFEGEKVSTDDLSRIAQERGHDGIIIKNLRDSNVDSGGDTVADHYSVFSPDQIRILSHE